MKALTLVGIATLGFALVACEKQPAPEDPKPEPTVTASAESEPAESEPEVAAPEPTTAETPAPSAQTEEDAPEKVAVVERPQPAAAIRQGPAPIASPKETAEPPLEKVEPPPKEKVVKTSKGKAVSDAPFSVWLQGAGSYPSGKPGAVTAVLVAKKPYKCNDKYPYKFKLDAAPSGISFPSTTVRSMSVGAQRSTMSIPFQADSAGSKRISGTLSFSVCTDSKCLIEKRKLAVDVKVE